MLSGLLARGEDSEPLKYFSDWAVELGAIRVRHRIAITPERTNTRGDRRFR